MNKICVIIAAYNGEPWIEKCLVSLSASSMQHTLCVVDNASSDNTVALVKKHRPGKLICLKKNTGFGAANNLGLQWALENQYDFCFLLNQDACLEKNTLEKLSTAFSRNKQAGIISPLHLNGKGSDFDRNFLSYLKQSTSQVEPVKIFNERPAVCYEVPFVNAAAWMVSTDCIRKTGGFDSLFFVYGEDENYCQRVRRHGMKILIAADTVIYHDRESRGGNVRKEYLSDNEERRILIDCLNPWLDFQSEIKRMNRFHLRSIARGLIRLNPASFAKAFKKWFVYKQKYSSIKDHAAAYKKNQPAWL